ncbi:MAG: HAMP domain-containing protein [bacterium]
MASETRIRRIHSLRTQLLLGVIALLALAVGSAGYCLMSGQRSSLQRETQKALLVQGRSIARDSEKALTSPGAGIGLSALAETARAADGDILAIVITDTDGTVRANTGGYPLPNASGAGVRGFEFVPAGNLRPGEVLYRSGDAFVFRTPVRGGNEIIGHVMLSYSTDGLTRASMRALIVTLLCTAGAACIGALLSLAFYKRISEPLGVLMRGTEEIAGGKYSARIDWARSDEFGLLAESLNDMSAKIAAAQEKLVSEQRIDHELEIAREIQA